MYLGISKATGIANLILAIVRGVCVRVPTVVVGSLCAFLRERVRPITVVWLISDCGSVSVERRRVVLLLEDLANLLHVGVLDKDRVLALLFVNILSKFWL